MLIEKSSFTEFRAFDPATGQRWKIRATDFVTPRQARSMGQDPAMIRALAHHLAAQFRMRGHLDIQIFADAHTSLNGRPSQRLIDPSVKRLKPTHSFN